MIDLDRLKANLMTSGLQQKDNPLFQVISQLIDALRQFINESGTVISGGSSGGGIINATYLTSTDQTALLANSRELLAGTGIAFDISIGGELTITASGAVGPQWSVLTNGSLLFPELIFAGGDVIMLHTP